MRYAPLNWTSINFKVKDMALPLHTCTTLWTNIKVTTLFFSWNRSIPKTRSFLWGNLKSVLKSMVIVEFTSFWPVQFLSYILRKLQLLTDSFPRVPRSLTLGQGQGQGHWHMYITKISCTSKEEGTMNITKWLLEITSNLWWKKTVKWCRCAVQIRSYPYHQRACYSSQYVTLQPPNRGNP